MSISPDASIMRRTIVALSDFRDGWPPHPPGRSVQDARAVWESGARTPAPQPPPGGVPAVSGGYLERLPLAAVAHGLADQAEIWHFWRPDTPPPFSRDTPHLARRAFHLDGEDAPFASADMESFIEAFGPPGILCVWGLGVAERILDACRDSFKIYNSIDAPALRLPDPVAARFDLVLTGAEWQSAEVEARVPGMRCAVMPIGPEFADPETFRPLPGVEKEFDLVYVAAAQPYKRHDILFDAVERRPGTRALCVFGYGEMDGALREEAARRGLDISFVGPPGVPFGEVNALMNRARIGVVCGVDDGAPAILTEYMLAGLPVLANAELRCGLQFITPETGLAVPGERFHEGVEELLSRALDPRRAVMELWTWDHTIRRLAGLMGR
ncbi:MAG: glycosyl transferase family 1 [Mesorhizobium amorphae]|nr:MAG: glycosyl transferase family 1 [Mesorhizobium amorphae]